MLIRSAIALAGSFWLAGAASADFTLTILHTNDFHSRFEPISKYDSSCSEENNASGKCFGGSARLMSAIDAARSRAGHSILVDGGDQFQGIVGFDCGHCISRIDRPSEGIDPLNPADIRNLLNVQQRRGPRQDTLAVSGCGRQHVRIL